MGGWVDRCLEGEWYMGRLEDEVAGYVGGWMGAGVHTVF